jgi:hypothetical protein
MMEMKVAAGSAKEIILGSDFGEVVVIANGTRVQIHADGSVDTATTEVPVPERKPGDKMPDGTVFAGISPDSGETMYVTPADAPHPMTFNQAARYATTLNTLGH